jgi:hypothetical protein
LAIVVARGAVAENGGAPGAVTCAPLTSAHRDWLHNPGIRSTPDVRHAKQEPVMNSITNIIAAAATIISFGP